MALAVMRRAPAPPGGGPGGEVITEQGSLQDCPQSWEPAPQALECFVGPLPPFVLSPWPEGARGGAGWHSEHPPAPAASSLVI